MYRKVKPWMTLVLLAMMSLQLGCHSNPLRTKTRPLPSIEINANEPVVEQAGPLAAKQPKNEKTARPSTIDIQAGSDRYLGSERFHDNGLISEDGKGINLNFKNMDLQAFIQAVLGDALQQNYVIDPEVVGTVTIQTVKP